MVYPNYSSSFNTTSTTFPSTLTLCSSTTSTNRFFRDKHVFFGRATTTSKEVNQKPNMKSEYLAYGKKHKNEKYIKDNPYAAQDSKNVTAGYLSEVVSSPRTTTAPYQYLKFCVKQKSESPTTHVEQARMHNIFHVEATHMHK